MLVIKITNQIGKTVLFAAVQVFILGQILLQILQLHAKLSQHSD